MITSIILKKTENGFILAFKFWLVVKYNIKWQKSLSKTVNAIFLSFVT